MDYQKAALLEHKKHRGKFAVRCKMPLMSKDDLSIAYTPGVAAPCLAIAKNKDDAYVYTSKGNMVAVVTDGSAVLGLGNIGPVAALPVMEGKAVLFKKFGKVDAIPICLDTQDADEIIETVCRIAPGFGGINLEDISAPRCFEIEAELQKRLPIPVFHDDQHGTAIVVLAGLMNALKIVEKSFAKIRVVIAGAGAAGIAIGRMLRHAGVTYITMIDSKGVIYKKRKEHMNEYKKEFAVDTGARTLADAMKLADVFIGVSKKNTVTKTMVKSMADNAILFAMANPDPEIMPDVAKAAGARIVATGRSDFPNQVNNVLAFPGVFRGALDSRTRDITDEMKLAAAGALAEAVHNPSEDKIIPAPFDPGVAKKVAAAVRHCVEK